MNTYNAFVEMFQNVTILDFVTFIGAMAFLYASYKKISAVVIDMYESRRQHMADVKEALDGVRKYPEYREKSIAVQNAINTQIDTLGAAVADLSDRLAKMEEITERRERNRIRDRLLQRYRFYSNIETNPTRSWTSMEAEAFWEMFRDYEEANGDGFVHTIVQPEMEKLIVIDPLSK